MHFEITHEDGTIEEIEIQTGGEDSQETLEEIEILLS